MIYFKNKGFTLIELLVVIAIIGLLASVVLVSMKGVRARARDAQRKADLYSLGLAIQLYYNYTETFPNGADTQGGDWPSAYKTQLAPYISKPPLDPLINNSSRYYGSYKMTWSTDPNCNGQYVLWMYFEGTDDPDYGKYTCGFAAGTYFRLLGPY